MLFIFHCAESTLGRIDKSTLSQQTLMELVVEGITNTKRICGDGDNPTPIAEWNGIEYSFFNMPHRWGVTFDASGNVTVITFTSLSLQGSIQLEWLPISTTECAFAYNSLSGTLNLENLPDSLRELDLCHNMFVGTVNLTKLPHGLQRLDLNTTNISGETDFSQLPASLLDLDVTNTKLSGTVIFSPGCYILNGGSNVVLKRADN
mmetsp:Transcript_6853/g.10373  ORF Transcript_6853/g.10373 Transcript_6853/m.10373 type:complete len:205 (-) Transcript_6853:61-675(-)